VEGQARGAVDIARGKQFIFFFFILIFQPVLILIVFCERIFNIVLFFLVLVIFAIGILIVVII
jgi:hypothetical protein